MPQKTVLFDQHVKLGGRMVDFHDWLLPVQYEGILAEHHHCRTHASLFDTSHMGQFYISGPAAAAELSLIGTQNAHAMPTGRCQYGFLLDENAGILDDTILMRLAPDDFLLVVNAAPAAGDFDWIRAHLSDRTRMTDRAPDGARWCKLDLQGPESFAVLAPLAGKPLASLQYFHAAWATLCGHPCLISRSGYTGELGYEIFADSQAIDAIFQALLANPAVKLAGLGARDLLRLEMCYPLYGQDISLQTNPIEADLGHFIRFDRPFIGSAPLQNIATQGPGQKLVAFHSDSRRKATTGQVVTHQGRPVGIVTSAGFSPSLEVSIGLAFVESALAQTGTNLAIATDRGDLPIAIADKPLYKHGTCRTQLT